MDDPVKRVSKAADELIEHFDSVLIVATKNEDGTTQRFSSDRGNVYASIAVAEEWVNDRKTEQDISVRRRNQDD